MAGRAAVLTIQRDEKYSLPLWLAYYSEHFDASDIYVLDHESTERGVLRAMHDYGVQRIPVFHPVVYASDEDLKVDTAGTFIRDTATEHQRALLKRYEYVLYTDADELVVPAEGTLREFIDRATEPAYRCTGREVVEDTQHVHPDFHKTLLSSVPVEWVRGFHYAQPELAPTPELFMYHLHRLDFERAWWKDQRWHDNGWTDDERAQKREQFRSWFYAIHSSAYSDDHLAQPLEPLDDRVRTVLNGLGVNPSRSSATTPDTWRVGAVPAPWRVPELTI